MGDMPLLISNEGLLGSPWYTWNSSYSGKWSESRAVHIKNMKLLFPKAKILISFRQHSEFISSLYSQYLNEGGAKDFNDFFDISQNLGFIKKEDLVFKNIITKLKNEFEDNVFIFTLEEIHSNLETLIGDLQKYIGGKPPYIDQIMTKKHNVSAKSFQSKILKFINKYQRSYLNPEGKFRLTNKYSQFFKIDPRTLCQQKLAFLPSKKMTLPQDIQAKIDKYFADDWSYIQEGINIRSHMLS